MRSQLKLTAHFNLPLYRNGYALLLSGILSSALGMVYWFLAAHTYSPTVVGLNSAAISALMLLSGIAQMSMNSALIRFIPRAGALTQRLILACYGISCVLAVAIGVLYGWGIAWWTPALAPYLQTPLALALFCGAIASWSIYALQDSVLAGLRQSVWVPVENTLGALLKIGLLLLFINWLPTYGIFAAWMIPVLLSVAPINYLLFTRLIPAHVRTSAHCAQPLPWRTVSHYVVGNYAGTLFYLGYATLLPILVTTRVSASANAYFYIPWMLATALQLIALNLTTSLTVEGARDEVKLGIYCWRVLQQALYLVTPLAALLWIGTPFLLQLFGADYAHAGTALLRLLTIAALPNILVMLHLSVARVQNRVRGVSMAQGLLCLVLLGVSYWLLPSLGITAVGWAALAGQSSTALWTLFTPLRTLLGQGYRSRQQLVTATGRDNLDY